MKRMIFCVATLSVAMIFSQSTFAQSTSSHSANDKYDYLILLSQAKVNKGKHQAWLSINGEKYEELNLSSQKQVGRDSVERSN